MPATKIADPALTIRDLLKVNWVAANTGGVTPTFSTGWVQLDKTGVQVTVTNPDDFPAAFGIDGGGAGEVQFRQGAVLVHTWVPQIKGTRDSGGAKKLAYQSQQEVDRIVTANQGAVADFEHVRLASARLLVDTDAEPVFYRWQSEVEFFWIKQPAA